MYLQGGFQSRGGRWWKTWKKSRQALRSGKGVGWGDQTPCLFCTVGRFFRPSYHFNLVPHGCLGVAAKLERGATVADVGCGHGFSTIIMAKAFPKSTFVGYDFHSKSVEQARVHAKQHGATAVTRSSKSRQRANFKAKIWIW